MRTNYYTCHHCGEEVNEVPCPECDYEGDDVYQMLKNADKPFWLIIAKDATRVHRPDSGFTVYHSPDAALKKAQKYATLRKDMAYLVVECKPAYYVGDLPAYPTTYQVTPEGVKEVNTAMITIQRPEEDS